MKNVNIIVILLLSLVAVFLIYRLFVNEVFTKLDYLLLILMTTIGMVNSSIVSRRRKNEKNQ